MATCPTCRDRFADDVTSCPKDGATLVPDAVIAAADAALAPGDTVGEYRIEAKIGEGGFGAVYRAVHPVIGKAAAVKLLHRQFSTNPQMVSRFIAEAKAVNQIRHKNIIDIFSFGALPDGRQYYVMELLEGSSFEQVLRQRGRLPLEEAMPILRAVGRALDAAHAGGIVHRDLKPENIFLLYDEDGVPTPKLLDFGIAKLIGDSEHGHKTRTGTPMGTPYYMSPEQCHGRSVDRRTDIYSFGVMVHQVLTGRLLFDGDSVMDVLFKHTNAQPPRMSEVRPDLPPALDGPVLQMLAKDPKDRPASVMDAIDALAKAANEAGLAVPMPARPAPGAKVPAAGKSGGAVVVTPSGGAESVDLAQARTVAGSPSFIGASGEVGPKRRGRTALVAGMIGAALVAGALVIGAVMLRGPGGAPADAQAMTGVQVTAAVTATATAAQAPPPVVEPKIGGSAAVAPSPPPEVELSIDATPKDVDVYLGATKIGSSSAPPKLKSGEKVTLTFKAPGYVPAEINVTPAEGQKVRVTLVKVKAAGPKPPGSTTSEVQW